MFKEHKTQEMLNTAREGTVTCDEMGLGWVKSHGVLGDGAGISICNTEKRRWDLTQGNDIT